MNQTSTRCWMLPHFDERLEKIRVALPFCVKDAELLMDNLAWQYELDGRKDYDCVLSVDRSTPQYIVDSVELAAWKTYSRVEILTYDAPPAPVWPNAPNWALQHTALYMQRGNRSWLWMEPDCIPLRPGWLVMLNQEYRIRRKPIMGPIVRGMGHCNGTAVYPASFPKTCPEAMTCTDVAWDSFLKGRIGNHIHDAGHIMCHVWGIVGGKAAPFGGNPAHFSTWNDVVNWVDIRAAVFHRAKDSSLIERLREHIAVQ